MTENTRLIPLTQGKHAIVDAADYEMMAAHRWFAQCMRSGFYAGRNSTAVNGKRSMILMHRAIMAAPSGMMVDHINHNPLDNRRANLRLCTNAENTRNSTARKGATSQYIGVHWSKARGKWVAEIRVDGRKKYLGCHTCEIDAALAYDAAAREYFGEFANSNFSD